MSYNLNRLGSQNFEHLVQSLSKKIIGEGVSIFGAGPDGQREATFCGKAPYPSQRECWDGYWVIQAKFKEPNTKKADFLWIKECFEEEMKKFKEKRDAGKEIPNNYLFFTNIVLTPVMEKGIKDKIEEIANNYKGLIPNIHIIGADDINRFLEGNRDIAISYASYILSGDILSYLYNNAQTRDKERQKAFLRYLTQTFSDDFCSRMEQAGQVTEEKVSIDKVYVDLKFKSEETGEEKRFIEHAIGVGNSVFRFSTIEARNKDKASMVGFGVSNKYVLKGSAGQGKSTVCQFLAQIYRANFLKNFSGVNIPKVEEFLNGIGNENYRPSCFRVPVRIELRLYSAWMIRRKNEDKLYDLVTYISSVIAEKASAKFDNETLRLYFEKYSWIFFFDGLDEVPESSNRKDMMEEIDHFIQNELRQADTDALFFATTRPEGYVGEFNRSNFTHIDLIPLDKDNCFEYIKKLLEAIEDDSTRRTQYLTILEQGWDNEQIALMMQTPLQATIITILVRAGGEPPRDKYSLFKEYFDIIIKREKQKGMGTILNTNQELIEGVYYLLGFELQMRSSTSEGSDALLSLECMKQLIQQKLEEDGIEKNSVNYTKLLNDTNSMVVNRINFASEIREGYIGFSIRSMQEFLASVYIVKTFNDLDLKEIVKSLAKSSYWKNTFNFLVECIAKDKTYYLDTLIDTVLNELNGNDIPLEEESATKSVYYGSQVAFGLLANNTLKNKPRYENKLCKYIGNYCTLQYVADISRVGQMSDNVKLELVKYLSSLTYPTDSELLIASLLLQEKNTKDLLSDFAKKYAVEMVKHYYACFKRAYPRSLYDLVATVLNQGEFLDLELSQIIDIVKNIQEDIQSEKAKRTLFEMTICSLLGERRIAAIAIEALNDFFECDFSPLVYMDEFSDTYQHELTSYLTLVYPTVRKKGHDIRSILSLADKYSLRGLSLILKTIYSGNVEDYIDFFNKVKDREAEIGIYEKRSLISQDALMDFLFEKALNDESFELNASIIAEIKTALENQADINDLSDFINFKPLVPTYSLVVNGSSNAFFDFYSIAQQMLTDEEITRRPHLQKTIMALYSLQYQLEYQKMDESDKSTMVQIDKLNSFLKRMLDFANNDTEYNIWQNYIRTFGFLSFGKREWLDYDSIVFATPKNKKSRRYPTCFGVHDKEIILKNLVSYISISENMSAVGFLLDFIMSEVEYETLTKIDWLSLKDMSSQQILCLSVISSINTEQEVKEKLLPLIINDEANKFVLNLISRVCMPRCFLPLYIDYLNKFRREKNNRRIYDLEKTIVKYINTGSVKL